MAGGFWAGRSVVWTYEEGSSARVLSLFCLLPYACLLSIPWHSFLRGSEPCLLSTRRINAFVSRNARAGRRGRKWASQVAASLDREACVACARVAGNCNTFPYTLCNARVLCARTSRTALGFHAATRLPTSGPRHARGFEFVPACRIQFIPDANAFRPSSPRFMQQCCAYIVSKDPLSDTPARAQSITATTDSDRYGAVINQPVVPLD